MTPALDRLNVVITGGDGALGIAVVAAFQAAGATCHLPVFGAAPAAPLPGAVVTPNINLTDEAAVEAYYAGVPPIAASVHLAGGFVAKPIAETSKADLEKQVSLNLMTTFLCCREAVKAMRKSGGGRIVNVAARVVDRRDQLRQRQITAGGNLLESGPERVLEADAGFAADDYDRALDHRRF